MIERILDILSAHRAELLSGAYDVLCARPFMDFGLHASPNGSTVIAVEMSAETRAALPPTHQHLDLFLLEPRAELGAHFHHHASARIHILSGSGVAEVDGAALAVAPGDALDFPVTKIHNVRSGDEAILFASFQDHPILRPDGSVDYFAISA